MKNCSNCKDFKNCKKKFPRLKLDKSFKACEKFQSKTIFYFFTFFKGKDL